jgi:DNA polymerase-3 subunit epsilon
VPRPPKIAAFDIESTGPDPENSRIVTAFAGVYDVQIDAWIEEHFWLLNPGVPIDPGATAVHGYSDEDVEFAGTEAKRGVFDIVQRLDIFQRAGLPIAGANLRFDFTMLDREQGRHYPGMRPFEPKLVLDTFVMDKAVDPYRKGKRTLTATCAHFGIPVAEDAHDAAADCLMAARLATYLLTHRQYLSRTLAQVHDFQVKAAAEQARSLADYFRRQGNPAADTVQGAWPLVPRPTEQETHV